MSDGILSQKEIDALLGVNEPDSTEEFINVDVIGTVVGEMVEVCVSHVFSNFQTDPKVRLNNVEIESADHVIETLAQGTVITAQLDGDLMGTFLFAFPGSSVGSDEIKFQESLPSAADALNALLTSALQSDVTIELQSVPTAELMAQNYDDDEVIHVTFNVTSDEESFEGSAVVPISLGATIVSMAPDQDVEEEGQQMASPDDIESTQAFQETAATSIVTPRQEQAKASVQEAQFAQLASSPSKEDQGNLDFLLDVPLQVTVELGRTRMQIRDVLELGRGSVVELEKLAGEPVEVFVNGKLIAKGEVVTIDENFGVKITDIASKVERVHNLQ